MAVWKHYFGRDLTEQRTVNEEVKFRQRKDVIVRKVLKLHLEWCTL